MKTDPLANLNYFQIWMVEQNLQYVETEGLEMVLNRLRNQGYFKVARAILDIHKEQICLN